MLSNASPHGWQTRARCGVLFADQELCETRRGVGPRHALSIPLLLIRELVTRGNEALSATRRSWRKKLAQKTLSRGTISAEPESACAELLGNQECELERLHVVEPRVAERLVPGREGCLVDLL